MGCPLCILHWIAFINKRRYTHLCLHDSFHIFHSLQHLCPEHGPAIQRRWKMERLPLRRTILHHTQFRCQINPVMARVHRNFCTILKKLQETEAPHPFLLTNPQEILVQFLV